MAQHPTVRDTDIDYLDFMPTMMMGLMLVLMVGVVMPLSFSAQQYFASNSYNGGTDAQSLTATGKKQSIAFNTPLMGAYFVNDGPGTAYVSLIGSQGTVSPAFTMRAGETVSINRAGADERICSIHYSCLGIDTATIRVIGQY